MTYTTVKLFRCLTCKKDFLSPETLADHLIGTGRIDYSDVRTHKIRFMICPKTRYGIVVKA